MTRGEFARKAEELRPVLIHRLCRPVRRVLPVKDENTFAGYRMEKEEGALTGETLKTGDAVCWDFGEHLVGHITFKFSLAGTRQDAPVRMRLIFGEMPDEIACPEQEYTGWLSAAWLQTETITLDLLPPVLTLSRRYAFRYVRLEIIAASLRFGVRVEEVHCDATTSAGKARLPKSDGMDGLICQVSLRTLRDCMQDFFEDGPKRDRRLWIGDLRLQALANHHSFRNADLVRRCLYMIAAAQLPSGWLPAAVYDTVPPTDDETVMVDYALLFGVTLRDLLRCGGELETGRELYPICRQQAVLAHDCLMPDGTFSLKDNEVFFIDWKDELQRDAAALGSYLYGLDALHEVAIRLGETEDAAMLAGWLDEARRQARKIYWDPKRGRFVSGGQISMASQIWMLLGDALPEPEAKALIRSLMEDPPKVDVGTPYMKHYLCEAMWKYGYLEETREMIRAYWGKMIDQGADTFWEVFVPEKPDASPYGHRLIHSRCHAWSCTPFLYLIG